MLWIILHTVGDHTKFSRLHQQAQIARLEIICTIYMFSNALNHMKSKWKPLYISMFIMKVVIFEIGENWWNLYGRDMIINLYMLVWIGLYVILLRSIQYKNNSLRCVHYAVELQHSSHSGAATTFIQIVVSVVLCIVRMWHCTKCPVNVSHFSMFSTIYWPLVTNLFSSKHTKTKCQYVATISE